MAASSTRSQIIEAAALLDGPVLHVETAGTGFGKGGSHLHAAHDPAGFLHGFQKAARATAKLQGSAGLAQETHGLLGDLLAGFPLCRFRVR
jgi:hypothetical protein